MFILPHCTFRRSLALGQQYSSLGSQPILCGSIPGLVPKQLRFCRNYIEIMPSVAEGVKLGIQECQHQFRGRRWNCTTIKDNLAIFGPVLDKGKSSTIINLCEKELFVLKKTQNSRD